MTRTNVTGLTINPDAYYTEAECAALRRKSTRTIARERISGAGCAYVRNGKSCLYKGSAIIEHLARSTYSSTSEEDAARRRA